MNAHISHNNLQCMKHHGCTWKKFCTEYKGLLARIQRRCGEPKPSCPVTYQDIERHMDNKESRQLPTHSSLVCIKGYIANVFSLEYEQVFKEMTNGSSMLPREQIMKFFHNCGYYPLEREIDAAFRSVFKGKQPLFSTYWSCSQIYMYLL